MILCSVADNSATFPLLLKFGGVVELGLFSFWICYTSHDFFGGGSHSAPEHELIERRHFFRNPQTKRGFNQYSDKVVIAPKIARRHSAARLAERADKLKIKRHFSTHLDDVAPTKCSFLFAAVSLIRCKETPP